MDDEIKKAFEQQSETTAQVDKKVAQLHNKLCSLRKKWVIKNWVRITVTLVFTVCVAVVFSFAGCDIHRFLNNHQAPNVATTTTVTTNSLICCSGVTNSPVLFVYGTNAVPVSVTTTTTTATAAVTDGQWYALILLLVPLILSAIVALRRNDDD